MNTHYFFITPQFFIIFPTLNLPSPPTEPGEENPCLRKVQKGPHDASNSASDIPGPSAENRQERARQGGALEPTDIPLHANQINQASSRLGRND